MWIQGLLSLIPAASSRTRYFSDSLSLPATAQPAEPAPVTMKSYVSIVSATIAPLIPPVPLGTIVNGRGIGKGARISTDWYSGGRRSTPNGARTSNITGLGSTIAARTSGHLDDSILALRFGKGEQRGLAVNRA